MHPRWVPREGLPGSQILAASRRAEQTSRQEQCLLPMQRLCGRRGAAAMLTGCCGGSGAPFLCLSTVAQQTLQNCTLLSHVSSNLALRVQPLPGLSMNWLACMVLALQAEASRQRESSATPQGAWWSCFFHNMDAGGK